MRESAVFWSCNGLPEVIREKCSVKSSSFTHTDACLRSAGFGSESPHTVVGPSRIVLLICNGSRI